MTRRLFSYCPRISPSREGIAPASARPAHQPFNLIALLPSAPAASPNLDAIRRAVLYIEVRMPDGQTGSGTGFLVTPSGYCLTAYHVIENAKELRVSFEAEPERRLRAEPVGWDAGADLAVLQSLEGGPFESWFALAGEAEAVPLGEEVGVLSYPLGELLGREITYTPGVVTSLREGGRIIQLDAVVTHGSSGAPVFRRSDFRVIGVIHGGVKQELASGLNLAISVQEVYRHFRGH